MCYEFLSAHIKKCSTSAYELCIEEYELRMFMMYHVRVTYLSYLDTP